jgi:hypothetical protein
LKEEDSVGKTLAEKVAEAADKPVPDETLTVAWWDCDPRSLPSGNSARNDEIGALRSTKKPSKKKFKRT